MYSRVSSAYRLTFLPRRRARLPISHFKLLLTYHVPIVFSIFSNWFHCTPTVAIQHLRVIFSGSGYVVGSRIHSHLISEHREVGDSIVVYYEWRHSYYATERSQLSASSSCSSYSYHSTRFYWLQVVML